MKQLRFEALTFGLRLPFGIGFADDEDVRGCAPGPGEIDRAGTSGGGPGSAAGERRVIDLCEVDGACIAAIAPAGVYDVLTNNHTDISRLVKCSPGRVAGEV